MKTRVSHCNHCTSEGVPMPPYWQSRPGSCLCAHLQCQLAGA